MSDHDRLLACVALAPYQKCMCGTDMGNGMFVNVCQRPATFSDEYGRRYCDGHADGRMNDWKLFQFPEAKHIRWLERKATGG